MKGDLTPPSGGTGDCFRPHHFEQPISEPSQPRATGPSQGVGRLLVKFGTVLIWKPFGITMVNLFTTNPKLQSFLTGEPTVTMNNNQENEHENSVSQNENEMNNKIITENQTQRTSSEAPTNKWQTAKNRFHRRHSFNQREREIDVFNTLFGPRPYFEKFYVMKFPGIKIDKDLNMRGAWEDIQKQIGGKPQNVTRNGYESLLIETKTKC